MRVIYFTPDCPIYVGELEIMPQDELLTLAKNMPSNEAIVYNSTHDFQEAFNAEEISDLGFIFFVEK